MSTETILVTGAGRGAGRGIALALARTGRTIAVCDLDADAAGEAAKEIEERGATAASFQCDVSDETAVDTMVDQVVEQFGPLEVLVNTVAWIDPLGSIADMPTERWHKALRTNLDSVLFGTRAALRSMIPNTKGVIINVSSINGTRGFPDRACYGATKAAVINLTQTTAMENRAFGIRANVLVPGSITGDRIRILREMKASLGDDPTRPAGVFPDPKPEALDPEWIGRYVDFLISDDGRFINGQALVLGEAPRSPLQAMFPDL
jgi:NAD(P)-dependent dehydrogenase (short-subunit alcohol dehydrogenase family)